MRLLSATNDFTIGTLPYRGFPLLLWDNMESCQPANQFLRHYLLRGAIGSRKSWASTGRALYDFFSFLQAHELHWTDVDRGEAKTLVAAYRDYCLEFSKLKRATVRNRLLYVCEFYAYAQRQGWVDKLPFGYDTRKVLKGPGFLAHADTGGGTMTVRDVMPRLHKNAPEFLTASQVRAVLAAAANPHHLTMLQLALGTGLRKEELATFPVAYVFDPERAGRQERNLRLRLDPRDGSGMKTKGDKVRDIYLSRCLMQTLHQYAIHHRGSRACLRQTPQRPLFLNQNGEPFGSDGKSLDRIVRLIGQKAGIRVWTHLLRHTYATHTLVAMQHHRDRNRIEPVVFLQRQLGHSSVQTTMVYLHLVDALAERAVLTYDDELDELMMGAC